MKILALLTASLALAACGRFGTVNQGRVVAFDRAQGLVTLISDSNYRDPAHPRFDRLPPVTIHVPADRNEMGPEPQPGLLLSLDCAHRGAVLFDPATQSLRTLPCDSPEYRNLPSEARRFGDEIRYYYKDPAVALRLMNVTKTVE